MHCSVAVMTGCTRSLQGQAQLCGWASHRHAVSLPALSTNMMTLRKGELGTPSSGREAASLTLNHFCASSSNVSTRQGRLDSFVLASLHSTCFPLLLAAREDLSIGQDTGFRHAYSVTSSRNQECHNVCINGYSFWASTAWACRRLR